MNIPELVASVRYKPGWRFRLTEGPTFNLGAGQISSDATTGNYATTATTILVDGLEPVRRLLIEVEAPDSDDPSRMLRVTHTFPVPWGALAFDGPPAWWRRWLLDRIFDVERHEAMEFFRLDNDRVFYPDHGPGMNPYAVVDHTP
jgi:hypothetical protein